MITTETRKLIAQAIAKAIAYKNCDKPEHVEQWAITLLQLLECNNLLKRIK